MHLSALLNLLNRYLQKQVSQDVKRKVATCFVAVTSDGQILGYYTLAATGVALSNIPTGFRKKLPRYPTVPAVLMGRLAVDRKYGGFGLGSLLLADALKRISKAEIAAYALIVEAKDEAAISFYRHFGFTSFEDAAKHLFFPLANLR